MQNLGGQKTHLLPVKSVARTVVAIAIAAVANAGTIIAIVASEDFVDYQLRINARHAKRDLQDHAFFHDFMVFVR